MAAPGTMADKRFHLLYKESFLYKNELQKENIVEDFYYGYNKILLYTINTEICIMTAEQEERNEWVPVEKREGFKLYLK